MSPQAGWILQEEVVPRLRASIPRNVSYVEADDAEELVWICPAQRKTGRAGDENFLGYKDDYYKKKFMTLKRLLKNKVAPISFIHFGAEAIRSKSKQ